MSEQCIIVTKTKDADNSRALFANMETHGTDSNWIHRQIILKRYNQVTPLAFVSDLGLIECVCKVHSHINVIEEWFVFFSITDFNNQIC